MKPKSIAGIVSYVKDTEKTADFYEGLGFIVTKRSSDQASVRLNWFWIDFHDQSHESKAEFQAEAVAQPKGAGTYLYVSVADVDEYYKELTQKGYKPSGEPKDWPWGNREFVLRDPDGYKLVFFKKL